MNLTIDWYNSSDGFKFELDTDFKKYVNALENTRKINLYSAISLIVIGLIGHFLTIFVLAQKRFRRNSSSVYLLCLAVIDALFLIIHFFEDTLKTYIELYVPETNELIESINLIDKNNLSCRLINYIQYTLAFISTYTIVAFTIQRVFLVYSPFSNSFKSTNSAWLTFALITLVSLFVNLWVIFLFEIDTIQANHCDIKKEYVEYYFQISILYNCIKMLMPIIIIFICNLIIVSNLVKPETRCEYIRKNRRCGTRTVSQMFYLQAKAPTRKMKPHYVNMNQLINRVAVKANNSKKLTKLLVLISCSYAFLNLPYLINWYMYYYVDVLNQSNQHENMIKKDNYFYAALKITELFYLLNFSMNFYIYCASGSVFRNQLKYSSSIVFFVYV